MRDAPGTDLESGYLSHNQIGETSQNKGLGAETGKLSSERLVNLVDALQAIGRDLDEQYTIGYKPLRDALDGTYRSIKVETTRRGVDPALEARVLCHGGVIGPSGENPFPPAGSIAPPFTLK